MSNSKRKEIWLKASGICGLVIPIITVSLILLAISYSPWFNWTQNALSDLGVGDAAVIFNSALIIGGILTLIFAAGLAINLQDNVIGLIGSLLLALTAASLISIGLFPESAGYIHMYVSISFFTLDILTMLLVGVHFVRQQSARGLGTFSVVAAAFALIVWVLFFSSLNRGVAIPEMLAGLTASTWTIVFGYRLMRSASGS